MNDSLFEISALDRYTIQDIMRVHGKTGSESLEYALGYLFSALANGSLCIDLHDDSFSEKNFFLAGQCIENYTSGIYSSVISTNEGDFKPLIMRKTGNSLYLYFYRYYSSERKFEKLLKEKITNAQDISIDTKICDEIKQFQYEKKIALYLALTQRFLIVTGGPGTGKTFTAAKIAKYFSDNFYQTHTKKPVIKLTAPTGKAAKRLSEQITIELSESDTTIDAGETIHRLLQYKKNTGAFTFNSENTIPADLIIVDEVSMIDINLFSSLLDAVSNETTLIIIGDRDQLPSVDAGAVLKDLLPDGFVPSYSSQTIQSLHLPDQVATESFFTNHVVELKKQYRSGEKISVKAAMINAGESDMVDAIQEITLSELSSSGIADDVYFIPVNNHDDYIGFLNYYFRKYYMNNRYSQAVTGFENGKSSFGDLFDASSESRILTLLRDGFYGSTGINEFLLNHYRKSDTQRLHQMSGVPVMITSNDYSNNLFNGESGVISCDEQAEVKAFFPTENAEEKFRAISLNFLPSYTTSFSITVHKSQGSQYKDVFVVLPNDETNPLLTREIIYTAITRAKEKVFIVGDKNILKKAISGKITRFSGIGNF